MRVSSPNSCNGVTADEDAAAWNWRAPAGVAIGTGSGGREQGGSRMRIIQRCEISVNVADPGRIGEFRIERMKPGFANEIFSLFLRGTIQTGRGRLAAIRFSSCNVVLDELAMEQRRKGLFALFGDPGVREFEFGLNLLGAPPEARIGVEAVFASGAPVALGTIDVARVRLDSAYVPQFSPVILNSMGRSGTTLLMRMLSFLPGVYVHREYPHELLAAHYWINFLESLSTPQAGLRLTSKWNMRDRRNRVVASNPYYRLGVSPVCARYLGGPYVARLARFCQENIDGIYGALIDHEGRARAGTGSRQFSYFAEKSLPLGGLIRELYPRARDIYLVRDVRDGICSALSFNRKRGTPAFGRDTVSSNAQFAAQRADEFRELSARYEGTAWDKCLVRYEDLIRDPEAEAGRLCRYLELDAGPEEVAAAVRQASATNARLSFHQTSASPLASIGRWKQELTPGLRAVCAERAGEALARFGYAP
ncbi:MAG: sulfotransferase [Gammaproteobacteria bacterium]|nr:sulfotransferase [Gammaproteobacteria bacterium]